MHFSTMSLLLQWTGISQREGTVVSGWKTIYLWQIDRCIHDSLQKMGNNQKIIYSDDEKAIASAEFRKFVEGEGIELYRTRGHPAFAESFIRTFKSKLFKRIENDEKNKKAGMQWTNYIDEIMVTYNYKDVHSASRLTPNKAREKNNELRAKVNIASKAKKERLYPALMVGNKVKIRRKKAITEKERTSHFLKMNIQ